MSLWIESHQTLRDHPKKEQLAETLYVGTVPDDIADCAAVGLLHYLWWWALDYANDGDLSGYSDRQIAKACRWRGDAHVLMEALTASGFVTEERTLHDWHDYAGKLLERREKNRERMREARAAALKSTPDTTCNARATHVRNKCGATRPNHTLKTLSAGGLVDNSTIQPAALKNQCPNCETDVTYDEEGAHCVMCGWRPTRQEEGQCA